ncbi:MAG: fused MFS/spermidine synthase, partial [Gemmataceae bacterium]
MSIAVELSAPPRAASRLSGLPADVIAAGLTVFFANAALLVLQLVAGRLLAPFIGVALETWTAIIGVFLAGISLGNAAGGRLAAKA